MLRRKAFLLLISILLIITGITIISVNASALKNQDIEDINSTLFSKIYDDLIKSYIWRTSEEDVIPVTIVFTDISGCGSSRSRLN